MHHDEETRDLVPIQSSKNVLYQPRAHPYRDSLVLPLLNRVIPEQDDVAEAMNLDEDIEEIQNDIKEALASQQKN